MLGTCRQLLKRQFPRFLCGVMLILTACSQPSTQLPAAPTTAIPSPVETPTALITLPLPTAMATATSKPEILLDPTLTPTSPATPKFTSYQIDARFDYRKHYLAISEVVTFTNTGPEAYASLAFQVEPNDHPGDISFNKITLGDGAPLTDYRLEGNRLSLPLPSPMNPGQSGVVTIDYDLSLPTIPPPTNSVRPVIFGYTAIQTNLVDWFPFLPPYQPGKGWIIHDPWYYGEHQVYPIADYYVNLTLLDPPPGLIIAAATTGQNVNNTYHFVLKQSRTFAFSAAPQFKVTTQSIDGVEVSSYAFASDSRASQEALQTTLDALKLYTQLYGPYHHASLSVVEGDFLDGMEYDGLFYLSKGFYNLYDGTHQGYLTAIAAHETAHQWFYGQVGNDQAMEPWLDEALATYSEKLFYEHYYPDLVKWWWDFRVNYYNPKGWINQPIYSFTGFEAYRNAVYLNGANFLDRLRTLIGDEAFFAFLRDYLSKNQNSFATTQDFFDILAKHTSTDISSLKAQFFK